MVEQVIQKQPSLLKRVEQKVKLTTPTKIGPAYVVSEVDIIPRSGFSESILGATPLRNKETSQQITVPDFPPDWFMVAGIDADHRSAKVYRRVTESEEATARRRSMGDVASNAVVIGLIQRKTLPEITMNRDVKMFDLNIFNDLMKESHNQSRSLQDLLNKSKLSNLQVKELERIAITP